MSIDRRRFLSGGLAASLLASLPADLRAWQSAPPSPLDWDAGLVRHILPAVSDRAILIKLSVAEPLRSAPTLRAGSTTVRGRMSDTAGEFWQFRLEGLRPRTRHTLELLSGDGRPLCAPWPLSTFPAADDQPERVRILFFTCAGGHEGLQFLPVSIRNRLLRRALRFAPDAVVANGDHVYWDQLSPTGGRGFGATPQAEALAGRFDRAALVFGDTNETVLKRAAGPQIMPVYGTDFRSTPVFFLQDDHDYFENDEGTDDLVTFPPTAFMLRLARATQRMYYPEFLPDPTRPTGLPWSLPGDRASSESYGTLRYGRLLEVLLYDARRTMTLAGPNGVFLDPEVERWLVGRTASSDAAHLVHAPSTPPGWSAGKWGEWYPDILDASGRLTTAVPKPYWQRGWLAQHDRLIGALAANRSRVPLVISGDLHALAVGTILRSGSADLRANPVTTVLSGPMGTRPGGWPSGRRGIGATPPAHLDVREVVAPLEQHGFTLADFTADAVELRLFRWDVNTMALDTIDTLEPFHTSRLPRR